MRRIRRLLAPARFAARRVAARPFVVGGLALALALAATLVGWSSIAAALAHEENVRLRLREASVDDRAFHVAYTVGVGGTDWPAADVSATLARLEAVTERPRRVRIWHGEGATAAGVRLVESDSVALGSGRLPSSECPSAICEALALAGDFRLGEVVDVDERTRVQVVGTGSLPPAALPDPAQLGPRAAEVLSVRGGGRLRSVSVGRAATLLGR